MADVQVVAATLSGGRLESMRVALHGLPPRTLDRATVLGWMRDGHSLLAGGKALQLVEVGDDHFVRVDNSPEAADLVPGLPLV